MQINENSKNKNDNPNNKNKRLKNKITPQSPAVPSSTEVEQNGKEENENCTNEKIQQGQSEFTTPFIIKDKSQKVANFLTLLTLIAFIVSISIQYRQTRNMVEISDTANFISRQLFDSTMVSNMVSDSLNRKAIEIADSSIKISKKIAALQEIFTKIELRPYVMIDSIFPIIAVNQNFKYIVYMSNSGKTPAYKATINCSFKFSKTGVYEDNINKINRPPVNDAIYETLGNGNKDMINCIFRTMINTMIFNKIRSGEITLYLFGCIFYEDIFGDEHQTCFCWRYAPLENRFYTYERYNYAN